MGHAPCPAPRQRQGEIDEALLDMLLSFSDFATFKQTILDYRKVSPAPSHTHPQLATAVSVIVYAGKRRTGGGANGLRLLPYFHQTSSLTTDTPQSIITYEQVMYAWCVQSAECALSCCLVSLACQTATLTPFFQTTASLGKVAE